MKSIFTDKLIEPNPAAVKKALGTTFNFWQMLVSFVKELDPSTCEEWKYSGDKFGWSFLTRDKKRVLVYFLPRDRYFKVAMVFGQKATECILNSGISDSIKKELNAAKAYAEGRGIRLEVRNAECLNDIKGLIEIKISLK